MKVYANTQMYPPANVLSNMSTVSVTAAGRAGWLAGWLAELASLASPLVLASALLADRVWAVLLFLALHPEPCRHVGFLFGI